MPTCQSFTWVPSRGLNSGPCTYTAATLPIESIFCVCLCRCVHVCILVYWGVCGGQRSTLGVSHSCPPCSLLNLDLSLCPETINCPEDSRQSVHIHPLLGWYMITTTPSLYLAARNLTQYLMHLWQALYHSAPWQSFVKCTAILTSIWIIWGEFAIYLSLVFISLNHWHI